MFFDMLGYLLGEHMKTSIFDVNFVLPPVVEMTEVVKEMPMGTNRSQPMTAC
jgi:hypothetical protein